MEMSEKIKFLRMKNKLTLEEVGNKVGVGKSTVRKWESGQIANMRRDKIAKLAEALNTTPAYLMGWEESSAPAIPGIEHPTFHAVPLLGEIACGEPILAEENLEGKVQVDGGVACDFALRCKGDSMAPRLLDGDLVFIRQQPSVDNGQIAAVLIDTEATLKHVYVSPSSIQLVAENPAYAPIVLTGEDAENARILGKAVAYRRMI
ncbi:MAG: LexA family transcriptional regulator [Clostridiales bacterium]|nr:LexA family transcriptional regulator [Clostridiales bacterium]